MKRIEHIVLTAASIILVIVMFLIPVLRIGEYSIVRNTISQMGAQVTEYAWITNLALVLLGISSILSGWKFYKGLTFHRFLILLFGISVILSAAFNSAPVDSLKPYDITEDGWHSYFLLTSWLTFLILTLSTAFILENRRDRVLTIVTGAIIIFLSLLNSEIFSVAGIWQRLIYLISTGWMIYCFRSTNR